MTKTSPIFTVEAECQDCYKCVRHCPVKAIQVKNASAVILTDQCILCAKCVQVCPSHAKRIRDDSYSVEELLRNKKAIALLAPSIVNTDTNSKQGDLYQMLAEVGFTHFSFVSNGANLTTKYIKGFLSREEAKGTTWASSACPAIVRYLSMYQDQSNINILPIPSPLLIQSQVVKELHPQKAIVFIGPCAAKKWESDEYPQYIDKALTIDEFIQLHNRMRKGDFPLRKKCTSLDRYQGTGTQYPLPGGMMTALGEDRDITMGAQSLSGISFIKDCLENYTNDDSQTMFLDLLSCQGGCMEGHCTSTKTSFLQRSLLKDKEQKKNNPALLKQETITLPKHAWPILTKPDIQTDYVKIQEFLKSIGKYTKEDEKDCGGCGYNSCYDFARMSINGQGEPNMCVSYLRKVAEKKAVALLHTIPCGVVIIDKKLNIVESNHLFLQYFAPEAAKVIDDTSHQLLEGRPLNKFVQLEQFFGLVLRDNRFISSKSLKAKGKVYNYSLFPIENNRIAGGIFQDITQVFVQRENIINKAKSVLETNVQTVQQIAFLLGENASASEVMLNSIIESFSTSSESAN